MRGIAEKLSVFYCKNAKGRGHVCVECGFLPDFCVKRSLLVGIFAISEYVIFNPANIFAGFFLALHNDGKE